MTSALMPSDGEYSSQNDTPTTMSSISGPTHSCSDRTPTPNPIPRILSISHIQPLLTSLNPINHINTDKKLSLSLTCTMPRIPLPTPSASFSLPPLPTEMLKHINHSTHAATQPSTPTERRSVTPVLPETALDSTAKSTFKRARARGRGRPKAKVKRKATTVSASYVRPHYELGRESAEVSRACAHNLKVKQQHLHEQRVTDVSFDDCYIFSMRCPYDGCRALFNDMATYQEHHTQTHQLRDAAGKLVASKAAKWTCPDCGKVSASWYNYAAHVTMHKDSCDAPWICRLPPISKKKYVQWIDGSLICGKRCSTKHNLIKHLKALHTAHRIIDLSSSVKAQSASSSHRSVSSSIPPSIKSSQSFPGNRRRSPRRNKKRPRFSTAPPNVMMCGDIVSVVNSNPFMAHPPPNKKRRTVRSGNTSLSLFNNVMPPLDTSSSPPHKSVKEQSDFVSLLLSAAEMIENERTIKAKSDSPPPTTSVKQPQTPNTPIVDTRALLATIQRIFGASANGVTEPASVGDLSAIFGAASGTAQQPIDLSPLKSEVDHSRNINNAFKTIDIAGITDIGAIAQPSTKSSSSTVSSRVERVMPDIHIESNLPYSIAHPRIRPISASNPVIALPKMPLPPSPPTIRNRSHLNSNTNMVNVQSVDKVASLLNLLNAANHKSTARANISIPLQFTVNSNTFNTFNGAAQQRQFPMVIGGGYTNVGVNPAVGASYAPFAISSKVGANLKGKEEMSDDSSNRSVISNNILSALPKLLRDE